MYRKHLRMARGEGEVEHGQGLRSHFVERVVKLPMVHVAWDYAANTYSSIKESNRLVNFTLTNAERSVNFMAGQAKPVVMKFERQIQKVDNLACKGLGTLEEKVPLITKRPEQIIGDTRKLYASTVYNRLEDIRKYGTDAVSRITEYGFQTASAILGDSVVNSMVSSVDGVLVMTENCIDYVLPPAQDETDQNDVKEDSDPKKSVVLRLARLTTTLRRRFYQVTLIRLRGLREIYLEIFNLPDHVLGFAVQNLEAASLYAQNLWRALTEEDQQDKDENLPLKRFLPILKPIVKRLIILYNSFISPTEKANTDANSTTKEMVVSFSLFRFVRDNTIRMIGLLRIAPQLLPMYIYSIILWFSKEDESRADGRVASDKINREENSVNHEQNHVQENDCAAGTSR